MTEHLPLTSEPRTERTDKRALAIDGGEPTRASWLPYAHQVVNDDDVEAVASALRSDWLTTGPHVVAFEDAFARYVGAKHAVAVSSGTAALHAAAFAAGVGPGDEAVISALTFVASANCVRYQGGHAVFADVRPDTLTVDPAAVERLIGPRTRAVVTVDYGGTPSDLDELRAICRARGVLLIEDAAHALGACYRGRRIGSIADLTTFSFHPVKQLTTGEGGMVTTDDDDLADRMRRFRSHGIDADAHRREALGSWAYEMVDLGFNYRLTDLQCALGRSQLARVPEWLDRRCQIARRYQDAIAGLPEVRAVAVPSDREPAWHLFVVLLALERIRVDRGTVFRALRAENVGVNVHYLPVPRHAYYRALGARGGPWPAADDAYERMLSLPMWAGMTDDDVDDVIHALRKVLGHYRTGSAGAGAS